MWVYTPTNITNTPKENDTKFLYFLGEWEKNIDTLDVFVTAF